MMEKMTVENQAAIQSASVHTNEGLINELIS